MALSPEVAIGLALELTQPSKRTREFSSSHDPYGNVKPTDNPAAMVGLLLSTARKWMENRGISFPVATQLAATFNVNNGALGQFLRGDLAAKHEKSTGKWIQLGRGILAYVYFGNDYKQAINPPHAKPASVDDVTWLAWQRIERVLFRDPVAGIPRFFRGRRRTWSGAWSEWELVHELERVGLHCEFLSQECELVLVSGGRAFPQTDSTWNPKDPPGSRTIEDVSYNLLQQGVKVRFIYPADEQTPGGRSCALFYERACQQRLGGGISGLACPAADLSFLSPALQFAYLRTGTLDSLLILRGFEENSIVDDHDPITAAATPFELKSFRNWYRPLSGGFGIPPSPLLPQQPPVNRNSAQFGAGAP